jgi:hypothetical protein
MKFPIVMQGDWMSLSWCEAETREQALIKAATEWVEFLNENEPGCARLDPQGPVGFYTPNLSIEVQKKSLVINPALEGRKWSPDLGIPFQVDGDWETESMWTIPDYEEVD